MTMRAELGLKMQRLFHLWFLPFYFVVGSLPKSDTTALLRFQVAHACSSSSRLCNLV